MVPERLVEVFVRRYVQVPAVSMQALLLSLGG